jgi:hypothetical protein
VDVDEAIDQLYGLPLDRFTPERDALARRLRRDGARAAADRVKRLRKPSVAAWAVNRVARGHEDSVRALLASVDELREAQTQAVRGDPARFREAAEAHRLALDRVAAEGLAALQEAGGASATIADRVRETLQAAAQDPSARDDLAAGRLTHERAPGGLDALGLAGAVPVAREPGAKRRRVGDGGGGGKAKGAGKAAAKGAGKAAAKGAGKAAATGAGKAAAKGAGKAAATGGGQAAAKGPRKAAKGRAEAPDGRSAAAGRPAAGERRRARDAARQAEQRAESARRRLARAEEAAATARDALEEARAAVADAEQEADATSARERELSGTG